MKSFKKIILIIFKIAFYGLFVFFVLAVTAHSVITQATQDFVYNNINKIPYRKVGLLLGASKKIGKNINQYFLYRINATVELYKAGKIKYIIVSGDNHIHSYNEPEDMRSELIAGGIPDSCIISDFAGFRTYDSVIRAKKVFGQNAFTIISQEFHNKRALYIAHRFGLDAVAYNAREVTSRAGFNTRKRELFAVINVFFDLLINKQPKFLGEPIEID
jgi:SanA protein